MRFNSFAPNCHARASYGPSELQIQIQMEKEMQIHVEIQIEKKIQFHMDADTYRAHHAVSVSVSVDSLAVSVSASVCLFVACGRWGASLWQQQLAATFLSVSSLSLYLFLSPSPLLFISLCSQLCLPGESLT